MLQLNLPLTNCSSETSLPNYSELNSTCQLSRHEILAKIIAEDLDFKAQNSSYGSHNLHAFAAKFPPQLPYTFIEKLTAPGETILDPMMGSGTALIEAYLLDRQAIGCDLDFLAIQQSQAKTNRLDPKQLTETACRVVESAKCWLASASNLEQLLCERYTPKTLEFIQYWLLPDTQLQLLALLQAIEQIPKGGLRRFMEIAFSAIIVTKSGGVSLALDLAHSRPHRVMSKVPRNAIQQFESRISKNIKSITSLPEKKFSPTIYRADARLLPLADDSVDLIVTSPPYANAIDYMRAHKFSLVWLGKRVEDLAVLRSRYIGAEKVSNLSNKPLSPRAESIINRLSSSDQSKARVLRKYYNDMRAAIEQMFRVLRPNRAVIIVVGSSTMRGIDVETHSCLADLAAEAGFDVVGIAERKIDRDKRMMPTRFGAKNSMIEERMHSEYVIACIKPNI